MMNEQEFKQFQKTIAHIDKSIEALNSIIKDTDSYLANEVFGEKRALIRKVTTYIFQWKWSTRTYSTPMADNVAILLHDICKKEVEELQKHKEELLKKLNK